MNCLTYQLGIVLIQQKTEAFIGFRSNIVKSIRFNADFLVLRLRISFRLM